MRSTSLTQMVSERPLGDLAELGCEQGGIDLPRPPKAVDVDGEVDQSSERAHRAEVARFGSLNAQIFGLTINAFAGGALLVNALVERVGSILTIEMV